MLERLGVNTRDANMNTKNTAAVMVTAKLPAFVAAGSPIDATVSAMGDAKSLLGGTPLVTPVIGANRLEDRHGGKRVVLWCTTPWLPDPETKKNKQTAQTR